MALRSTSTPGALIWAVLPLSIVAAHRLHGAPSESSQPPPPPPIRPLRYEEDYLYLRNSVEHTGDSLTLESLKYISLNQGGDWYLSLGGEVKQEYEFYSNRGFGSVPNNDDGGYLLQRYVLYADLHAGERLRFFGQLYSAPTAFEDIEPSPVDQDNRAFSKPLQILSRSLSRMMR